jgi:hypothetical protein
MVPYPTAADAQEALALQQRVKERGGYCIRSFVEQGLSAWGKNHLNLEGIDGPTMKFRDFLKEQAVAVVVMGVISTRSLRYVPHWLSSDRMTEQFHKGKNRRKRSDVHGELHHGGPVCVPNQRM